MAYQTGGVGGGADGVGGGVRDRHYFRKHGPGASYGQG